eukprot:154-Pyramimonas_sp.AAC.1
MMTTAAMDRASKTLRERDPALPWVVPKGISLSGPTRHDLRRGYAVVSLVQWQLNAERPVIVEGSAVSSIWEIGGWDQLCNDHRLFCHIVRWRRRGITHPVFGIPSRRVSKLLTNIALDTSYDTCSCPQHHQSRDGHHEDVRSELRQFVQAISSMIAKP